MYVTSTGKKMGMKVKINEMEMAMHEREDD